MQYISRIDCKLFLLGICVIIESPIGNEHIFTPVAKSYTLPAVNHLSYVKAVCTSYYFFFHYSKLSLKSFSFSYPIVPIKFQSYRQYNDKRTDTNNCRKACKKLQYLRLEKHLQRCQQKYDYVRDKIYPENDIMPFYNVFSEIPESEFDKKVCLIFLSSVSQCFFTAVKFNIIRQTNIKRYMCYQNI